MRRSAVLLCVFLLCCVNRAFSLIPIPLPLNYTAGGVWPKPVKYISYNSFLVLRPASFNFKVERYDCDIIQEAIRRYYHLIFINANTNQQTSNDRYDGSSRREDTFIGYLDVLQINLMAPCEIFPSDFMDERYELLINANGYESNALIVAQSVWGVLRGLETFSQIVVPINGNRFAVRTTSIVDFPRFSHRGLLIDTSRHYLPVKTIIRVLDAMSYSKLNVLHWHIVDDQSFPYQSNTFPNLSDKGSYEQYLAIYSQVDVRRVIEHARLRGIRVIPEFDSPGHTLSWGKGIPNLLTQCSHSFPQPYGPIDPTNEYNYVILEKLFKEIHDVFPDKYLHLGGDEVEFGCWESNDNITDFMRTNRISSYPQLEAYYIYKLLNITNRLNAKAIVWQEVFDNNVPLRNDTIVQVWKGDYLNELEKVTHYGYPTLLSSCWYLDSLESGGDWERFYRCNPLAFPGTQTQKRLVLGGEVCMWGEVVDETNIQQRIWPRACAAAEVLWYGGTSPDAPERIEEHVCRLKKRGIPAQPPNGPAFCPYTVM